MWRPRIRGHVFDWMGDTYGPYIDPDHFLGHDAFAFPRHQILPPTNVKANGSKATLEIAVPGFTKEDIDIQLRDGYLIVKGEKSQSKEETGTDYVHAEFAFDSFARQFKLAEGIRQEQISAKCENGILTLTFSDLVEKKTSEATSIAVA